MGLELGPPLPQLARRVLLAIAGDGKLSRELVQALSAAVLASETVQLAQRLQEAPTAALATRLAALVIAAEVDDERLAR